MNELNQISMNRARKTITEIDEKILELLSQRVSAAKEIGAIKIQENLPTYVPEIEKKKIEDLSSKCIYKGMVEVIWPVIMCYTRTVE